MAERLAAVEGMRGWLAMGVLFVHVCGLSNIGITMRSDAGDTFVTVFMIISGFVITHLLVTKQESSGVYITRRFMRLFPVFALTCIFGYLTVPLVLSALPSTTAYAGLHDYWSCIERSQTEHFWANLLAHSVMLHGALSAAVLPCAATTFNAPAWSLSLEWQFYLLAPLGLALTQKPAARLVAVAALALLCLAARHGAFGQYQHESFLLISVPFFAVGVASRFAYPLLAGRLRAPTAGLALLTMLAPLGWSVIPLLIWGGLLTLLITDRHAVSGIDAAAVRLGSLLLESRVATYVGKRSYSIYLIHLPILNALAYFLPHSGLSGIRSFLTLLAVGVAMTLPLSCASYALVERPGIAFGNRLAMRLAARRAVPAE